MATGVSHALGGMVYKTFTAPQSQVKKATHGALGRMQVKVVKTEREGSSETINARAGDRDDVVPAPGEDLHERRADPAGRAGDGDPLPVRLHRRSFRSVSPP